MSYNRFDLRILNYLVKYFLSDKINTSKFKNRIIKDIKVIFPNLSDEYLEKIIDAYLAHLNSSSLTPLGKRLHLIMANDSLREGARYFQQKHQKKDLLRDPVFIVGLPRSGTTNLHNLLIDDFGYTGLKFWELTSPSRRSKNICIDRIIRRLRSRIGFYLYRYFIPTVQSMHRINMDTYEECWFFQKNMFICYNYTVQLNFLEMENFLLDSDSSHIFSNYKNYLRTKEISDDSQLALKCPDHLFLTNEINKVFPNSKFLWIHRNPYDAIISYCSMINAVWSLFLGKTDNKVLTDFITNLYMRMLNKMIQDRKELQTNVIDISYNQLINNRNDVIDNLSTRIKTFGLKELKKSPDFFKNKNKPNKNNFHISKEEINKKFEFYFEEYNNFLK